MACFILLFIVILTTVSKVTLLHCFDQQLPASGDDIPDILQAAALQYCLVDNCTIMKIDTGEKLDIAYTTDSLIITTPTDGYTSVMIAKLEKELPCFTLSTTSDHGNNGQFIGSLVLATLISIVSGYNIVVHLVFKELRNTFGKLVILLSFSVVIECAVIVVMLIVHHVIVVSSWVICQVTTTAYMSTDISVEGFSTCVLTHLAYVLYRSYNRASEVSTGRSKHLLRRYITYVVSQMTFFLAIIISYDLLSGTGRYTLQSDGHCIFFDENSYATFFIWIINTIINKFAQISMLAIYLFYFYKIKKSISRRHKHKLSIVAITMGATIGLSQFIWITNSISGSDYSAITSITGAVFLLLQQCVITINFMCTDKMSRLCKELFQKNQVTPNAF